MGLRHTSGFLLNRVLNYRLTEGVLATVSYKSITVLYYSNLFFKA